MAVRRHIGPVMVMMTVMAVDLHLFQTYGISPIVSMRFSPSEPASAQFFAVTSAAVPVPVPGSRSTSINF